MYNVCGKAHRSHEPDHSGNHLDLPVKSSWCVCIVRLYCGESGSQKLVNHCSGSQKLVRQSLQWFTETGQTIIAAGQTIIAVVHRNWSDNHCSGSQKLVRQSLQLVRYTAVCTPARIVLAILLFLSCREQAREHTCTQHATCTLIHCVVVRTGQTR